MPSKRNRNDKSNKGKSLVADVSTLLQRAQNCIDKMDGKGALLHLEEALKQQPDNLEVVDKTANVYMELGEDEKAFPLLVKSAKEDPDHNYEKWMYLGQLQNGNDAVTCYRKGIQLLEAEVNATPDGEDKQMLLNRLCGAYCSVGELYMTDLCEEPDAEQNCEGCITHGLSLCPDNVDGLVMLASCRMSQCRFDDAEQILMHVSEIIAAIDTTTDFLPAYDVRLFAGKMLLELDNDDSCRDRCEAAVNLFDQLLLENDENNELLFLMATAHYNLQSYSMGLEFATVLEKRIQEMLKREGNIPELCAQMEEVQKLLKDLRDGQAANPEAEKMQEIPEEEAKMQEDRKSVV